MPNDSPLKTSSPSWIRCRPGSRPPRALDLGSGRVGKAGEPFEVALDLQPAQRQVELGRAQGLGFVGQPVGQAGHERIAVGRWIGDVIARLGHGPEKTDDRRRRVEPDGIAESTPLGREGAQDHGDPTLGRGAAPEPGIAQSQPGQPRHPVGHRPVGAHRDPQLVTVVDHLVEGGHRTDDPPVELGDGDAGRGVVGAEAGVGGLPVGPGGPGGRALNDRDAQVGQGAGVPGLAVESPGVPGDPGTGADPPGGQDRGDQDVDAVAAHDLDHRRRRLVAQRVAPDGERIASGRFEAVADVGDELGVPGHEVGPVEDDRRPAGRPGSRARRSPPDAELLDLLGGVEAVPLEQHGVGHEPQQVLEILRSAVDQIGERLGHRGAGHRRERRHLGVGDRLAAEGQQRDTQPETCGAQVVEPLLPGLAAPEQANQDAAGVAEVQRAVDGPRLRATDGRESLGERLDGGAQRQHLGVDVGDVPDHLISPTVVPRR